MKKAEPEKLEQKKNEMVPEYDFTEEKGVRGKYFQAYRQGYTVRVHEDDGTVSIRYFSLEDGAVMLEPEVREYFPDSEAVNTALRSLIALIPAKSLKHRTGARGRKANTDA